MRRKLSRSGVRPRFFRTPQRSSWGNCTATRMQQSAAVPQGAAASGSTHVQHGANQTMTVQVEREDGLEVLGLGGSARTHWNLGTAPLCEAAVRRGEATFA